MAARLFWPFTSIPVWTACGASGHPVRDVKKCLGYASECAGSERFLVGEVAMKCGILGDPVDQPKRVVDQTGSGKGLPILLLQRIDDPAH